LDPAEQSRRFAENSIELRDILVKERESHRHPQICLQHRREKQVVSKAARHSLRISANLVTDLEIGRNDAKSDSENSPGRNATKSSMQWSEKVPVIEMRSIISLVSVIRSDSRVFERLRPLDISQILKGTCEVPSDLPLSLLLMVPFRIFSSPAFLRSYIPIGNLLPLFMRFTVGMIGIFHYLVVMSKRLLLLLPRKMTHTKAISEIH
jgi:hypothetical protein